ncbi:MAG: hypothetical protein ABI832_10540 [bacterium]
MPRPSNLLKSATLALMLAGAPGVIGLANAEVAVAPEKNPPGDIPDTQVFVTFTSDAGYSLKVPEGWARSGIGTDVTFTDKLDGVSVSLASASTAPNVDWAKAHYLPQMVQAGRAVKVTQVSAVELPVGSAVLIAYSANSDPNPVTSKQLRLEGNRYLIWHKGAMAVLDMTAPFGADNVDQWKLMSDSFRWQ